MIRRSLLMLAILQFCFYCSQAADAPTTPSKVLFTIPPAYGAWTLDEQGKPWVGARTLMVSAGKHTLTGAMGWKISFAYDDGSLSLRDITEGPSGRDLGGLLLYGHELSLPNPDGIKVILAIPENAGSYAIDKLLAPDTGHRAVWLGNGTTTITSASWDLVLEINAKGIAAKFTRNKDKLPEPVVSETTVTIPATPTTMKDEQPHIFINTGRAVFLRDELIPLTIQNTTNTRITQRIIATDERDIVMPLPLIPPAPHETRTWNIPAVLFHAGALKIMLEGKPDSTCAIMIQNEDAAAPEAFRIFVREATLHKDVTPGYPIACLATPSDTPASLAMQWNVEKAAVFPWIYVISDFDEFLTGDTDTSSLPLFQRRLMLEAQAWRRFSAYRGMLILGEHAAAYAGDLQTAAHEPEADIRILMQGDTTSTLPSNIDLIPLSSKQATIAAGAQTLFHATHPTTSHTAAFIPKDLHAMWLSVACGAQSAAVDEAASITSLAAMAPILSHLSPMTPEDIVMVVAEENLATPEVQATMDICMRASLGAHIIEPSELTAASIENKAIIIPCPTSLSEAQKECVTAALAQRHAVVTCPDVISHTKATTIPRATWGSSKSLEKPLLKALAIETPMSSIRYVPSTSGTCKYLWLLAGDTAEKVILRLPVGMKIAYDIGASETVAVNSGKDGVITCERIVGEKGKPAAQLLAFLPEALKTINVSAGFTNIPQTPGGITFDADLLDTLGNRVSGAFPARIDIISPQGIILQSIATAFIGGRLSGTSNMAQHGISGIYTVQVTCPTARLSGKSTCTVTLRDNTSAAMIRQHADIEVEDISLIRQLTKNMEHVTIITGTAEHFRIARTLCDALTTYGVTAEASMANEYQDTRFDIPTHKTGAEEAYARLNIQIPSDVILLGSEATNPLLAALSAPVNLLPHRITASYPGPKKSILQYAWRPFSETHDAIIIGASDDTGLEKAVAFFIRDVLHQ